MISVGVCIVNCVDAASINITVAWLKDAIHS